jgi:hypothetical protein
VLSRYTVKILGVAHDWKHLPEVARFRTVGQPKSGIRSMIPGYLGESCRARKDAEDLSADVCLVRWPLRGV